MVGTYHFAHRPSSGAAETSGDGGSADAKNDVGDALEASESPVPRARTIGATYCEKTKVNMWTRLRCSPHCHHLHRHRQSQIASRPAMVAES